VIGFVLRRVAASLLLLLLVLTVLFVLLHIVPGDPTYTSDFDRMPPQAREQLRRLYGLDRPIVEQYGRWLAAAVRFDWGVSLSQIRPVKTVIAEALPATLILAGAAFVLDLGGGLLLGVAAARRSGSAVDHAIRVLSLVLYSQPTFWLGLMAILVFSFGLHLLPASHMHSIDADALPWPGRVADLLRHMVLPACVLGLTGAGATARFVRASLLDAMGRDYIRTARAKGLSERRVIWVHGLRTALVPLVQLAALLLPALLSGSLVTEVVFAWPGLGRVAYGAIQTRDFPLILATTGLSACLVTAGNLLADLLHAWVDPRVRNE
jgi:peptide/nickel transport system permease protein